MVPEGLLISLFTIAGSALTSFITWLLSRRKYGVEIEALRQEVKSSSLDNEEKRLKIYNELITNYETLLKKAQAQNDSLTNKIFEQDKKIYDQQLTINKLENEISILKNTITRLSRHKESTKK